MITYKARSIYAHSNSIQKSKLIKDQLVVGQSEMQVKKEKRLTNNNNQMQLQKNIVVKTKLKEPFKDKQLTYSNKDFVFKFNRQNRYSKEIKFHCEHDNFNSAPNDSSITELQRASSNRKYYDQQIESKAGMSYKRIGSNSNIYNKPCNVIKNKNCKAKEPLPELNSSINAKKEIEENTNISLINKADDDIHHANENKSNVSNCNEKINNEESKTMELENTNANSNSNTNADNIKPQVVIKKKEYVVFNPNEVKENNTNTTNYHSNTNNFNSNNAINEDNEYFSNEEERLCELTEEEKHMYGNREMKNHKKQKLLGKGGCGIVWLCECKDTNQQCAVKQVSKKGNNAYHCKIAKNEIEILTKLNESIKCEHIVDIYKSSEDNQDIWISLERGGKSLANLVFKIKGEFYENERIYSIRKGLFLMNLLSGHLIQFKVLIKRILHAISYISSNGIVHSDLKPENLLVEYNGNTAEDFNITSVKVIDFGSAFYATNPSSFNSNTPEYMCPEITELLELTSYNKEKAKFLADLVDYPWAVDVWSLGITLLELVVSCPIWMSFKAKIIIQGKTIFKTGIFGTKGRDGTKIHQKQMNLSKGLHKILNQSLITDQKEKSMFRDLLSQMLHPEYKKRISPNDALNHPFLVI